MSLFKKRVAKDPILTRHDSAMAEAVAAARRDAALGRPDVENDSLSSYTGTIQACYRGLLAEHTRPGVDADREAEQAAREQEQAERSLLAESVAAQRERVRQARMAKDAHPDSGKPTGWLTRIGIYLLIGAVSLTESLLCSKAFSVFFPHTNALHAVVTAGLMIVFIVLPHFLLKLLREYAEHRYRYAIWAAAAAGVIIGFWTLAELRSMYLVNLGDSTMESMAATSTHEIKKVYFIGLNLFLLMVGMFCAAYLPDSGQEKDAVKGTDLKGSQAREEAKLERLERELADLPARTHGARKSKANADSDAARTRARITNLYHECLSTYMGENMARREGGQRPRCFDQPLPSLD